MDGFSHEMGFSWSWDFHGGLIRCSWDFNGGLVGFSWDLIFNISLTGDLLGLMGFYGGLMGF